MVRVNEWRKYRGVLVFLTIWNRITVSCPPELRQWNNSHRNASHTDHWAFHLRSPANANEAKKIAFQTNERDANISEWNFLITFSAFLLWFCLFISALQKAGKVQCKQFWYLIYILWMIQKPHRYGRDKEPILLCSMSFVTVWPG